MYHFKHFPVLTNDKIRVILHLNRELNMKQGRWTNPAVMYDDNAYGPFEPDMGNANVGRFSIFFEELYRAGIPDAVSFIFRRFL